MLVKWVDDTTKCFKASWWGSEYKKPTTKDDLGVDLISRNEVLNKLASIAKIKVKSDAQKSLMGRCMFMVERMPSVTPQEPRKGRWIGIDEEPHEDYECDKCGYTISTYTANIEPHTEYKFCPNCGCRMIEPQESEGKE